MDGRVGVRSFAVHAGSRSSYSLSARRVPSVYARAALRNGA